MFVPFTGYFGLLACFCRLFDIIVVFLLVMFWLSRSFYWLFLGSFGAALLIILELFSDFDWFCGVFACTGYVQVILVLCTDYSVSCAFCLLCWGYFDVFPWAIWDYFGVYCFNVILVNFTGRFVCGYFHICICYFGVILMLFTWFVEVILVMFTGYYGVSFVICAGYVIVILMPSYLLLWHYSFCDFDWLFLGYVDILLVVLWLLLCFY